MILAERNLGDSRILYLATCSTFCDEEVHVTYGILKVQYTYIIVKPWRATFMWKLVFLPQYIIRHHEPGIQWYRYWITFLSPKPFFPTSPPPLSLFLQMNSFQVRTPAIYSCHPSSLSFSLLSCFLLHCWFLLVVSLLAFFTHICFHVLFLSPDVIPLSDMYCTADRVQKITWLYSRQNN